VLQNVYISLLHVTAARTAGIDRNEEITSLPPYVYARVSCLRSKDRIQLLISFSRKLLQYTALGTGCAHHSGKKTHIHEIFAFSFCTTARLRQPTKHTDQSETYIRAAGAKSAAVWAAVTSAEWRSSGPRTPRRTG